MSTFGQMSVHPSIVLCTVDILLYNLQHTQWFSVYTIIFAVVTILALEKIGNLNINTGATSLLRSIVN